MDYNSTGKFATYTLNWREIIFHLVISSVNFLGTIVIHSIRSFSTIFWYRIPTTQGYKKENKKKIARNLKFGRYVI